MKETLKPLFPIALTSIGVTFFILLLSIGISHISTDIFSDWKNPSFTIFPGTNLDFETSSPFIQYCGKSLTVGQSVYFPSLFESEPQSTALEMYLLDVTDQNGNSILTILDETEINSMEEIPSAAIYDKENALLSFHKSGIYRIYFRAYIENKPGILYEFQLPVETR